MSNAYSQSASTIVDGFVRHVVNQPNTTAFKFLGRHARDVRDLSWIELSESAKRLAALYEDRSYAGQPIAIICGDPRDFIIALVGCFLSAAIAVPVPAVATRRSAARIAAIIKATRPKAIVANATTLAQPWIGALLQGGDVDAIELEQALRSCGLWSERVPKAGHPALMQFTSGSTGCPSGVFLTHANIAANCSAISTAYDLSAQSRGLSWLPLHHDMGLVGHVLTTLLVGGTSVIMDPLLFLQCPLRWLRHISEEHSTITSAPNFAYELCCKAASSDELQDIDLSSLATAVCGGEVVWPDTIDRFCRVFEPHGFRRSAFAPSYGLAEATLLVSTGKRREGPRIFSDNVRVAGPDGVIDRTVCVTGLGSPVKGTRVRIVDSNGETCLPGVVGEIEVSGISVGRLAGEDDAADRILTGDLGFTDNGEIFVVGRSKEVIIVRGQNIYPADIEAAALKASNEIEPGGIAAVAINRTGTESLLLVFELGRRSTQDECIQLCRQVSEEVARSTGYTPWRTIAVRPGTLSRTSSGKIQRSLVAAMFMQGELRPLVTAPARTAMEEVQA